MGKKSTRRLGVALTAAALALSLVLPGVASAQGGGFDLTLNKDCGTASASDNNALGQCNYQLAAPSGGGAESEVSAANENVFVPKQELEQKQSNFVGADVSSENVAVVKDNEAKAYQNVYSGKVDVEGHSLDIKIEGDQIAKANPEGDIHQMVETGRVSNMSFGDNKVEQDTGAYSSASNDLIGPAIAKDNSVGNGAGAFALGVGPQVKDAEVEGGNGGVNVNAALGSNEAEGGSDSPAVSVNLAAALSAALFGTAGNGNAGNAATDPNVAASAAGNAVAGFGALAAAKQDANGGNGSIAAPGGDTNATGGSTNGSLTNGSSVGGGNIATTGAATSGNIGPTNAGAYQLAASGNVNGDVYAALVGGTAWNANNITVTQSGAVTGTSGNVENCAAPLAQIVPNINQTSNPSFSNTYTPSMNGTNGGSTNSQSASSGTQNSTAREAVSSGEQKAGNIGAQAQDSFKAKDSFNPTKVDVNVDVVHSFNGNEFED